MRHIECDSFWLLSHFEWHSHLILLSGWWCFVATTTVAMVVDVLGRCFYSFCIWIVVLVFCIWVCLRWFIDEVAQFEWFEHFFCAHNQCLFCLYNIWIVSLCHALLFFPACLYFCNMFPLILIYLKLFLCFFFQLNVDIMSMCQSNLQINLNICVSNNFQKIQAHFKWANKWKILAQLNWLSLSKILQH